MISLLWFVTLAKVTLLDFICQLYLKIGLYVFKNVIYSFNHL